MAACGALIAALGAGCGGGEDDAVPLTTAPAGDSTTTTQRATTTTLDFETEVKLAALELIELRNEVFMNPDVNRVSEYISETCVCLEAERGFIEDFASGGRRWTGPAIVPMGLRLDDATPASAAFVMVGRQPSGAIAGPDGSTTVPEVPLATFFLSLVRAESGDWRINALDELPIDPEAAQRIVDEEGLP